VQTFGNNFESDGRLAGGEIIETVQCDPSSGCPVRVPAPGFALVFLTEAAFSEVDGATPRTFPTTANTATLNTVRVAPSVLATSNGHTNMGHRGDVTSPGSRGHTSASARTTPVLGVLASVVGGATLLLVRKLQR
jgi:hypothetical protein